MRHPSVSQSYGIFGTSWTPDRLETRHGPHRRRQLRAHAGGIDEHAMTAMQLTGPFLSRRRASGRPATASERDRTRDRSGVSPAEAPPTVTAQFRPLDPGILNETIPAFFIGRNMEGFWVARDAKGQIGGIFLLENSALSFAKRNSRPAGCATIFPAERFELDLENSGNPLVGQLGSLKRLAMQVRQRFAAFIGRMTEAAKRRLNHFHFL
jgi:hypothetical protein